MSSPAPGPGILWPSSQTFAASMGDVWMGLFHTQSAQQGRSCVKKELGTPVGKTKKGTSMLQVIVFTMVENFEVGHVIFCQGRIKAQFTNSNKQESNWILVELFRACAVR